jgi:hypothetical protein
MRRVGRKKKGQQTMKVVIVRKDLDVTDHHTCRTDRRGGVENGTSIYVDGGHMERRMEGMRDK